MKDIISPGSMLGVLGGGQLGAMFAVAARRLGYRVAVWDPDPDASALRVADQPISAPFTDSEALARFAGLISAVTYEWENVPVAVVTALEQSVLVRPAGRTLGLLQNRIAQKTFLASHNLPVAPFRTVSKTNELTAAAE
ncbi:MAG: 5-(carboxyamino)imidazole ribonucleotide synthase, partial [Nitrospiraceae bacterium]